MKILLSLLCGLWIIGAIDAPPPLKKFNRFINEDIVRSIREAGTGWEAYNPDENPLLKYTEEQLKGMMTVKPSLNENELFDVSSNDPTKNPLARLSRQVRGNIQEPLKAFNFPTTFNWTATTNGSKCQQSILDQGSCGSSYAFATSTAFSARMCIATLKAKGTVSAVTYSPQDLLSCHRRTDACNGGILDVAHMYVEEYGLTSLACQPYTESATTSTVSSLLSKCNPSACTSSGTFSKSYCKPGSTLLLVGKDRIKNELYQRGPLATTMTVYSDFASYKSGIYKYTTGNLLGGLSVVLIGWGTQSSTNFWIAQNAWGATWGEGGFFRVDMADTNTKIASSAVYCIPLV